MRIFIALFLLMASTSHAFVPESEIMQGKRLTIYTPHIFNPKYFDFEFGLITKKRISSYHYNAFAKAFIAEEFYNTNDPELRAGALGIKMGIFLPTQKWFPLFLELGFGYAKTSLHKDPWLGDRDDSVATKSLLLAEGGLVYLHKKKILFRCVYQVNNIDYFDLKTFVSIGFNY